MFVIKNTKNNLYLYHHHEYGSSLTDNGFLAFVNKSDAEDLLKEVTSHDGFIFTGLRESEQYPIEEFIIEEYGKKS